MKDKVAIVCGSSKGMGKAIAKEFAKNGARIVLVSRNEENLMTAMREITTEIVQGGDRGIMKRVLAIPGDVRKREDIERVVRETVEEFGTVHILVNNTGGPPAGYFEDLSDDDWYNAFNLTFMSAMRFIREVAPYMKRQKYGRIINITSMSVKQPIDNLILSNSIRLAVVGMAKTLALQWAKYGITINNIAPGPIFTERMKELSWARAERSGITYEEALNAWIKEVPAGRFGEPEEVAYLASFLASERAGFITGATIQIDGGAVKFVL
ncbi:dehydrogenase of unknown specificity, short-chain alcohol dehydrogenase like protein [Aciduliprofundum sp. MAR08-339]|uniref:SDR family oxidoreductase n=1 Tax=Aciduliprofundum sp. (strain MAR08-339) TaxID=673860 RepID=UPI0002A4CEA0|nr:dehydrogenase of unknown specificity, short-chain alcohol dehydrogenase like protein [Aciduliprofundum sp. MAR08-339]